MVRRFGFPESHDPAVAEAEENAHSYLEEEQAVCDQQWSNALRGMPLLANALPDSLPPLRRLSRKYGIAAHIRGIVWLSATGVARKMDENANFCARLLSRNGYAHGESEEVMAKDIVRTFPDHPYFSSREVGVIKLKHVLHALCWRNPLLEYCQAFNFLAGMMLLVTDDEEATFWLMCHLLEELLPNDFYGEGLVGLCVDQKIAQTLLCMHCSKLRLHFDEVHYDVQALVAAWILPMYINIFPIHTVMRIWDYLLTQERPYGLPSSVPLAVLIAFLIIHADELLTLHHPSDISLRIGQLATVQHDASSIITTANDLRISTAWLHAERRSAKGCLLQERAQRGLTKRTRRCNENQVMAMSTTLSPVEPGDGVGFPRSGRDYTTSENSELVEMTDINAAASTQDHGVCR
jgi:hypothetical protein